MTRKMKYEMEEANITLIDFFHNHLGISKSDVVNQAIIQFTNLFLEHAKRMGYDRVVMVNGVLKTSELHDILTFISNGEHKMITWEGLV